MKNISLNIDKALGTVSKEQVYAQEAKAMECIATLHNGNGAGNDFLGWLHLPSSITDTELADIENTANVLRSKCEVVVAIGIGGSYLGTKAVVEALNNSFDWLQNDRKNPVMLYAGHNIGEDYLYELSEVLKGKQFGIINISKSGTTTEPALAFRILKKQLEDAVGKEEAKHRIVAITDAKRAFLSLIIWPLSMPLLVTSCIRAVKRLRSWLTSIRNCIISQNGGNNFMERAKVKTVKVFSPHL